MKKSKFLWGNKAVAEYLGMPVKTVNEYVSQGILPRKKLGRGNIFRISEIEEAIK